MQLILNGNSKELDEGLTLGQFLKDLGLPEKGLAVERNLEIVPKSAYDSTQLEAGDRLEVIQFVGGG
ncbi:sulfur carrier protein ThiS [Hirschia baltica]|uniref:Thiamine biosynthesis protein ThiS n=1 Tax=Hirschia baltica (strain ATCC 49814 / DSM 5838 / IFAM 1418) TaxID=582402 RepID=C6XKL8_HIRBI|nr:sulfur carrier protein ThiS [Hirschia baltica]ACT59585.1 thiamine biosynthesis protein ThiS [Hirschia baltica ATCC 49814]